LKDYEIAKIGDLISKLDTAVGKLIVPAMENSLVKEPMNDIREVSFELGSLIEEE
jgi:hypothetical protein